MNTPEEVEVLQINYVYWWLLLCINWSVRGNLFTFWLQLYSLCWELRMLRYFYFLYKLISFCVQAYHQLTNLDKSLWNRCICRYHRIHMCSLWPCLLEASEQRDQAMTDAYRKSNFQLFGHQHKNDTRNDLPKVVLNE